MMKLIACVIAIMAVMISTGCATQGVSSYNYTAPKPVEIKNEAVVNKPYSQVWDEMVREISKSYFVINNIDKDSRIINLSFNTNTPVEYVDCGHTHRTYIQGDNKSIYDYEVAGPAEYKVAGNQRPHPSWASYGMVRRSTSLEGRSNIYIAPDKTDKNSTVITVNTRYIWTNKIRGQLFNEHFSGKTVSIGNVQEKTDSTSFNTKTSGEMDNGAGNPPIICRSKGKIENEILGLINK